MSHKVRIERIFDAAAHGYAGFGCDYFNQFGKALVNLIPHLKGKTCLDIATGKGAVLFPLADRVGPTGKVIGIDISAAMIKEAQKKIRGRPIELKKMDAEDLDFPDQSFDHLFCAFSLFFFPHLERALSEFHRVLKSGGTLAVSVFEKVPSPIISCIDIAKEIGKQESTSCTSLHDEESLIAYLKPAGFKNIQFSRDHYYPPPLSTKEWWESFWHHGTRGLLEPLPKEQLETIKTKACQIYEETPKNEPYTALFAIGTK